MNKFLIAGNWKMNTLYDDGEILVEDIIKSFNYNEGTDVLICPPLTHIIGFTSTFFEEGLYFGAQTCHYKNEGAYTGEVSAQMIHDLGCLYVISGHSERRTLFGETDEVVNKKVKAIRNAELIPIMCIGETLEERNAGKTYEVLERQIIEGLKGIEINNESDVVIAYEPVWAIGTGVSATTEQADEAHNWIRKFLLENYGDEAKNTLLLYGGSMKPSNAEQLLSLDNVNGGLIGGASLKAQDFTEIINIANNLIK